MKRRLFTLAAAVSLVLCIATVGLWLRSYWFTSGLHIRWISDHPQDHLHQGIWTNTLLCCQRGIFSWSHNRSWFMDYQPRGRRGTSWWYSTMPSARWHSSWSQQVGDVSFAGFSFAQQRRDYSVSVGPWGAGIPDVTWGASVPLWFIALIFALAPLRWLALSVRFRAQRQSALRCPTCGYDLRATPERCPECGNVPRAEDKAGMYA